MEHLPAVTVVLILLILGATGSAAALLVWGVGVLNVSEETARLQIYVSERLTGPHATGLAASVRRPEVSGSFAARILRPFAKWVGGLLGALAPGRQIDDLRRQLAIAGNPLGLGPREFYGLRILSMLVGLIMAGWFLRFGFASQVTLQPSDARAVLTSGIASSNSQTALLGLTGAVFSIYVGTYLPKRLLRNRVRGRQHKIRRLLPDALDMLSVCADAGLGFDQALQRVSERWKTPLGQEFARVVAEMQMGVSRRDALRNLAERMDVNELSSFVAVIIQSDQLGMSIVQTLHAQAAQMRIERRHRAQEEARKAPLKMLFPMIGFILPAMFAVVLGPVIPQIINMFAVLRSNIGR